MGLLDFLQRKQNGNSRFVTKQAYEANLTRQLQMAPQTMEQLRKINVSSDQDLKIEFFFYTNMAEKAKRLACELEKMNYEVKYGKTAGDKSIFVITGWTSKMKMQDNVVVNWTKEMCEQGYKYDCDFDGWGTSPEQ